MPNGGPGRSGATVTRLTVPTPTVRSASPPVPTGRMSTGNLHTMSEGDHLEESSSDDPPPEHPSAEVTSTDDGLPPSEDLGRDEHDRDDDAWPWERIDRIACAVLLGASLLLVGLHVRAYPTLSPIDELQHIDYAIKAGDLDIVRRNELVGFEAMSEAACRGVDAPGYESPPCGATDYDPADFQERGVNTAASQFPPYYVVTGLLARAVTATGVLDSFVTAARLIGALWLGAALAVIWYTMSLLGVRRRSRAIVSALFLFTPLVLFHTATVNADASLMLTGALVLLAAVQYDRGRLSFLGLILTCTAVFFVEWTNLLAIAAAGLYLSARFLPRTDLPPRQRFLPLAIIPIGVLLRIGVVDRIRDWLFPPDPVPVTPLVAVPSSDPPAPVGVSFDRIIDQMSATFTPVQRTYLPPLLRTSIVLAFIFLTNWLLIGAMYSSSFGSSTRERMRWWGRVIVLMLLAAGPMYTFNYAYFSNIDYPAPGRFALPLIPLLMVVAADAIRTRAALWVSGAVAAGAAMTTLHHLLTP